MCEIVTGEEYEITEPRLAYKVVWHNGTGVYYSVSWNGRVLCAQPETRIDKIVSQARVTCGGLHVFWLRAAAERYASDVYHNHFFSSFPIILPVLVWGSAIPFEGGAAVEFATLAPRSATSPTTP